MSLMNYSLNEVFLWSYILYITIAGLPSVELAFTIGKKAYENMWR